MAERREGDGVDAALSAQLAKILANPTENIQIAAAAAARYADELCFPP